MPNPENLVPFKPGEDDRRNPGRPLGAKNRSTIARKILEMKSIWNADTFKDLQERYPEITKESTAEEIMTIVQLDNAVQKKDANSYKAIMDSAYGAPKQEVTGADGTPLFPTPIQFTDGTQTCNIAQIGRYSHSQHTL